MAADTLKELSEDQGVSIAALENYPEVILIIRWINALMINSDCTLYKCLAIFFLFFMTYLNDVSLEGFRIFSDPCLKFDVIIKFNLIDNGDD